MSLKSWFWRTDPVPIDVMSAFTALGWSLVLVLPGDTFARPAYAELARLAPESAWTIWFLFLGSAQLHLSFHSTMRKTIWAIIVNADVAATWLYIAFSFAWFRPPSTGLAVYLCLGILSLWSFLRTGREAGG